MYKYVKGFAYKQEDIAKELSSHSRVIVDHIIKMLLMPGNPSYYHWKSEIAGQINDVGRLKNTKKRPTADQVYDWSYGAVRDEYVSVGRMNSFLDKLDYDYELYVSTQEFCDTVDDLCNEYFWWLAKKSVPETMSPIQKFVGNWRS